MQLTQQTGQTCQVSVHLMFDGQGRGWMQPIDASCPRPGGAGAAATAFRYTVDEECSGRLTDAYGHFQLELERDEVELTAERGGAWRINGVALRQRELTPGELALVVGGKSRKPARPAASAAR